MGYHPRIETNAMSTLLTTRSRNSELWFVNNSRLEEAILGYAAKFSARYEVTLYAFAIEGNHIHGTALFPKRNRAHFMRDLNSCIARSIPRYVSNYPGGTFWARRYSNEFLPDKEDLEHYFFYTVLQPVQDGLVDKISDYPGYNCFHDAIWGIKRKFKVMNWAAYNSAKRWNSSVSIKDFRETVELKFERLPGYEHLTQKEYATLMLKKLEEHRSQIIKLRQKSGKGFAGRDNILKTKPGSSPKTTKTSTIDSHRPRILSICPVRRAEGKEWYFSTVFEYQTASIAYRNGDFNVRFPDGTYPPYQKNYVT